jgi:hypothetical protein
MSRWVRAAWATGFVVDGVCVGASAAAGQPFAFVWNLAMAGVLFKCYRYRCSLEG